MYRKNEEQIEMLKVCEKMVDELFKAHDEKKLNKMSFVSTCSFVCGFIYATFGDCEKYGLLEASIKFLINTYQSEKKGKDDFMEKYTKLLLETYQINEGDDNEKE